MLILRAVPAAVAALVITFSVDHSTTLGFVVFGVWAALTAIVLANGALRGMLPRTVFAGHAAVLVVGATAALVLWTQPVAVLLFLIGTVLGASGALELVGGALLRRFAESRDWIFVGAISCAVALVVLFIPTDYNQVFVIPDKVVPPLTASVIVVGLFGAYTAVVAVYLAIAGLSAKWANPSAASGNSRPATTTTEKK